MGCSSLLLEESNKRNTMGGGHLSTIAIIYFLLVHFFLSLAEGSADFPCVPVDSWDASYEWVCNSTLLLLSSNLPLTPQSSSSTAQSPASKEIIISYLACCSITYEFHTKVNLLQYHDPPPPSCSSFWILIGCLLSLLFPRAKTITSKLRLYANN